MRAETDPPLHRLLPARAGLPPMITVLLALVPLLFATGFLTWTMLMGAREQARSDAWAAEWVKNHRANNTH